MLLLSACAFAAAASMRLTDPLLPVFARTFSVSLAAAAAATTGFALAYGAAQLFFGPLGDRLGRLRLIVVGATIAALGSLGSALASDLQFLVASRIATGAFAAAVIPLSMAWIGDHVSFQERQPVLARYMIGQMLGLSTGQLGGGLLADLIGWRWAFALIALLFAGAALLLWRSLSADERRRPQQRPTVSFLQQSRRLFADRWARMVLLTVLFEGLLLFGAMALLASYLQHDFGIAPSLAGLVAGLFGFGGLAYAFNARRLVERIGGTGLALAGGVAFAVAMLLLVLQTAWWPALLASLVAGLGYYMLHNTLQTQATQLTPEARGATLAWFASLLWLGQGAGVAMAAALAERTGFHAVFIAAGLGLLLLALGFARSLRRRHARRADGSP